ncbi:MAG TPA: ABC transporter substrate-binding protein, partial [Planctomycetes bacterium]|nr:ABC transporter substrate-binding protein [Planctomycetota bacterium]
MIDRRRVLVAGGAALAGIGLGLKPATAGSVGSLRVASLRFGSLSWVLETIRLEGLAKKAGLDLTIIDVATNQAGPVALLSGDADIIVSDWPWALRQRGLGENLQFAPYSSALGAVMVPKDSSIATLADLEGKKLGVAGSPIDKSWLLLRAYSRNTMGKDLYDVAEPVYGAPPLLTEELRAGRIDAVLNFWTYAARLEGSGFKRLIALRRLFNDHIWLDASTINVCFVWGEVARHCNL